MTRLDYPRLLAWWTAVALVLVIMAVFTGPTTAGAQDTGCVAVDQNEMPRDCTFLEEHGKCLTEALDSYDTCVADTDDFFDRLICETAVQVDLFACNVALPWTFFKMIVD